jgi:hypothetical protein
VAIDASVSLLTIVRLEDWATTVWAALPSELEVSAFTFTRNTVPEPVPVLETDALVVRRGFKNYGNYRVDYPQCYGDKRAYGSLGILILAAQFRARGADVTVNLKHPRSEITRLVVRSDAPAYVYALPELKIEPLAFEYTPSGVRRHPWSSDDLHPDDLPFFDLTNERELAVDDEERAARDVLRGFGSIVQSLRFAALLLDLSRPDNATAEVALEGDAGFRGVARASAEIRLWLPGGEGWIDWDDAADAPS